MGRNPWRAQQSWSSIWRKRKGSREEEREREVRALVTGSVDLLAASAFGLQGKVVVLVRWRASGSAHMRMKSA